MAIDATPRTHMKWNNDKLFVKEPSFLKNTTRRYIITFTGGITSNVSALETGGNFDVADAVVILAPDGVGDTQWTDASGNGYNGTNTSLSLTSDRFGRENKSYNFDGTNYIEVAELPITTKPVSIIALIKDEYSGLEFKNIISTGDPLNQYIRINSQTIGRKIQLAMRDGIVSNYLATYESQITDYSNIFYYRDGTNFGIYNGNTLLTNTVDNFSGDLYAQKTRIGGYSGSYFDGRIELFAVYSRKLLDEERNAISEYRKYAPNLSVDSVTEIATGVYKIVVTNTGDTDYENVQIVVPLTGTAMSTETGFQIVEIDTPGLTLISKTETLERIQAVKAYITDAEGIATVRLTHNGHTYDMLDTGMGIYAYDLKLEDGENPIEIVVTDIYGVVTTGNYTIIKLIYSFERTTEGLITYQRKNNITATYSGEYPATAITMKLNGVTQELTQELGAHTGIIYLVPGVNVILWTIIDSNGNELQIVDAVLFDTDSPVFSFRNGKGDELTFASSYKAEYIIISIPGLNSVKTVYSSVQSLGQQGVTITGKNEEQLDLTASIIISTENTDRNMNELVREISNVFNPNLGQGTLIYQDYNNNIYELPCYVRIPRISMNPSDRTATTRLFTAELIAPNPYFNLTPAIIETVGYKVPKWTIPFTLPIIFSEKVSSVVINNDGDSDVPIVIRYFGTATNPVLQNETSGETLKLNATINYNEYFEVSTDLLNIYAKIINIDTGVETDAFNYLDINNMDFFKLYVGNNIISFSTDDESENAYVEIEYNKKYGLVE